MTSKLKKIGTTSSENAGAKVISLYDKLKSVHVKTVSYKQFKMAAMADIRAALKNGGVAF